MQPRAVADAMYAADRASRTLGIEITEVGDGHAVAVLTVAARHCNGHDVCHGGLTFTLADTAMAFASNAANEETLAAGASVEFLHPAGVGTTLTATARRIHQRGRSSVYDVDVVSDDGTVVALFRGRTRGRGRPVVEGEA